MVRTRHRAPLGPMAIETWPCSRLRRTCDKAQIGPSLDPGPRELCVRRASPHEAPRRGWGHRVAERSTGRASGCVRPNGGDRSRAELASRVAALSQRHRARRLPNVRVSTAAARQILPVLVAEGPGIAGNPRPRSPAAPTGTTGRGIGRARARSLADDEAAAVPTFGAGQPRADLSGWPGGGPTERGEDQAAWDGSRRCPDEWPQLRPPGDKSAPSPRGPAHGMCLRHPWSQPACAMVVASPVPSYPMRLGNDGQSPAPHLVLTRGLACDATEMTVPRPRRSLRRFRPDIRRRVAANSAAHSERYWPA